MDDAKKRELDELRKQIDPEVLKRVADAMGGGDSAPADAGGAAPAAEGTSSKKVRLAGGSGLSDLKSRIQRREKEIDEAKTTKPRIKQASMLLYDPSHFRAKQLGAALNRIGFLDVTITSDPQGLIRTLLNTLNDSMVLNIGIIVFVDMYPGLRALLASEMLAKVADKLPKFGEIQTFVVFEKDQNPVPIPDLDPKNVISLRHSEEFIGKRLRKMFGVPDPKEQ